MNWINSKIVMIESTALYTTLAKNRATKELKQIHPNAHSKYWDCQHLYFTSDEEIKEGDYILYHKDRVFKVDKLTENALQITNNNVSSCIFTAHCKKIIATTDKSLKIIIPRHNDFDSEYSLPEPSKDFLELYCKRYNEDNKTGNVLIEQEKYQDTINYHKDIYKDYTRLQINPDNTINIKPTKENWNREEVIETGLNFLKFLAQDHNHKFNTEDEVWKYWVKENL